MAGNPQTARMKAALKARVVPELRSMGFKGSFPHFRRDLPERIDLLTFQFSQWGPSFCIELGTCGPNGCTHPDGTHVPADEVRVSSVRVRERLGAVPPNVDRWFDFDTSGKTISEETLHNELVAEILRLLQGEAETWWQTRGMATRLRYGWSVDL